MERKGGPRGRRGDRGQSATVGVALLLGLTILGATAVVALGGAAIQETEGQSEIARAEQSMTLFDSQAAQVALGESDGQSIQFGYVRGNYRIDDDAGSIRIVHIDHDDNGGESDDLSTETVIDDPGDDDVTLYSAAFGSVLFENDESTIGYQGGGVFLARDGGSTVVSPPEFHYRGATLTLPVILTRGSGSVSGTTTARVGINNRAGTVYPDPSSTYPDGQTYTNPVEDGRVVVVIESRFAKGWGEYFAQRTEGKVTYPEDDVAIVELISLGSLGRFQMPGDGDYVTVPGATGGHNTERFEFTLRPDDSDSADFNNLQWSMYVDTGTKQFELNLKKSSGGESCDSGTVGSTDITAAVSIYYSPDGGSTYHTWHDDDAFDAKCEDRDGDGVNDDIYLEVDLVDDEDGDGSFEDVESGDEEFEYVDKDDINNLVHFGISGSASHPDPVTIDGHGAGWEPTDYDSDDGDRESIDRIINHYFATLPNDFRLYVDDKNSDTTNEGDSSGVVQTIGGGQYVTYLHVTENEIEVELD